VTPDNPIFVGSALVSLSLWTISYALIIRRGHLDGTWGMPFPALCLNLAYELVFGFLHPLPSPANYVNMAWFLVDLLILAQFLRHGRTALPAYCSKHLFLPAIAGCLGIAIGVCLTVTADLGLARGNSYLGWGADLLICASFVGWIQRREDVRGQSLWIAVTRMLGSWAIIPAQELEVSLAFVHFVYPSAALLSFAYLYLYVKKCHSLGIDPLRRL
jgi:hypothetical protein